MLRQKRVTPVRIRAAEPADANPLKQLEASFLEWTCAVGLAEQTARIRKTALDDFIRWADQSGIDSAGQIDPHLLDDYQCRLYRYRKRDGAALAASTRVTRLNAIKAFCKWLTKQGHVTSNPATEIVIPRLARRLPGHVLTVSEARRVLRGPDTAKPSGVRDRAMLELLYSTGMRRMELVQVELDDLDLQARTLLIRRGKGGRDRVVPFGQKALAWIHRYLARVRGTLDPGTAATLFLTDYGEPFTKNRLGDLVRRYVVAAGVRAPGACHLFRHACATHMLENGADIRYIQALLGHADLSTTQIYTHVCITRLRDVHAATHPRESIVRHNCI